MKLTAQEIARHAAQRGFDVACAYEKYIRLIKDGREIVLIQAPLHSTTRHAAGRMMWHLATDGAIGGRGNPQREFGRPFRALAELDELLATTIRSNE